MLNKTISFGLKVLSNKKWTVQKPAVRQRGYQTKGIGLSGIEPHTTQHIYSNVKCNVHSKVFSFFRFYICCVSFLPVEFRLLSLAYDLTSLEVSFVCWFQTQPSAAPFAPVRLRIAALSGLRMRGLAAAAASRVQ